MKITFLGTGTSQGIPMIGCSCPVCQSSDSKDKRLRSSVLIDSGDVSLVIDTGPDFRQQMLREKVQKLDAVLFTHEHKDHTSGLDDIRSFNYIHQRPMDVYAMPRVLQALKHEYAYIFAENKYPGIPQIVMHEINTMTFSINGLKITPITVMHHLLPILGYRINDLGYITDANYIAPEEMEKMRNLKVLIINCLRYKKHVSHFNMEEALQIIDDLKPESSYFIHMSHHIGLHREVEKQLPENIHLAFDGLRVEL